MQPTTLPHLTTRGAPADAAIIDDATGITISYRALADQVERLATAVGGAGLARGDAVALILPNGVELLILSLALARAGLVAAPVDPALTQGELSDLIVDTGARATITRSPGAVNAAAALGVSIWTPSLDAAGRVQLAGPASKSARNPIAPEADDVALLLHTSGTSGKPKVVPLSHANVILSAQHIAAHFGLTPGDRSLVVLPLFHGHGLIGGALATLASGGAVIVPPRFSASRFWQSFRDHGATWYTAVPTVHQILLQRALQDGAPRAAARFIRSCSAPMAGAVMHGLEHRMEAPVIEAYGLTEASHQVSSNPLPPRARLAGSVGIATGTQIAIADPQGRHLAAGAAGEVLLREPTLMRGYRNNPGATAAAFVDGWFRTGDIGVLDDAGYLRITGRIKDIINRGGEKISPSEIEAVLLGHPAVADAAVFAVPDPKYGEAVEAAVVLRSDVDPAALQCFCAGHLASFKVPRRIHIVADLPKNALGKLRRHLLTARFSTAEPA